MRITPLREWWGISHVWGWWITILLLGTEDLVIREFLNDGLKESNAEVNDGINTE